MSSRVSSALVAYISAVDAEELQGISYYKAATPEHTAVVCAMIPKVEVVRNKSLAQLEKNLQAGNTVQMLSECFSALLQAYSVAGEGDAAYTWAESADEEVKTKLQRIFEATQKELLESALDLTQVNVLLRAASLFPSLDREQVLKHIATDRKRSALTENTVALVGALLQDSNDAAKPEMKRWFLMVFDYLTRRFAEDAVLTGKVAAFAKALGGLIARKEIKLENIIPKSTLNAVLEAGLEKHINVPEVVYLAVNLVSLSSQKSLNLAKLLQMVLGHTDNPLAQRDTIYEAEDIHHHVAFLISKLFLAGKTSLCNIGTMNGVMALYRGTNGHIDGLLLMIITYIEGHLARSCAASVASWSVSESTEKPLISNVRGRLEVVVNAKLLAKSVFHLTPVTSSAEIESLDSYLAGVKDNTTPLGKAYDPRFMLPAITFCLVSTAHIIDAQAAIERNCVAYAMACLSSEDANIREMATRFLSSVVSKLEESPYRNKTQISHLILGLLASFSSQEEETKNQPLPSAMGIFLAQASQVLANPTHFLYEKVMELLLRGPLLQLHDLPLMLSTLQVGEEHHKEVAWILNILTAGLKTEKDLVLYRKRNVFGNVLNLYISPNSTDHAKERVLGLLWNAAAIEGGGTTLITRNGAIAWIEQMLGVSTGEDLMLKRLAARLWEGSAKTHVKEWSRGSLSAHFVGDGARLGAQMEVDVET
ncbi:hypothetical protein BZA05DRAFT_85437 [Tricharina praecox]|uniref:uncharacterized protein n=1 Tax=Tricharina praecox TaxID=43433 RepID=UPI002220653F|nr:uncharacterized protein BZA05DRAFT_85437 [Tricharina praecox]KAI5849196.1 hypothetical protein BZA05DRAFT_85437 [Tricharina praecox]